MRSKRLVPGLLFLWLLSLLLLQEEEVGFDADCGVVSEISAIVTPRFVLALCLPLLLLVAAAVSPLAEQKRVSVLFAERAFFGSNSQKITSIWSMSLRN